MLYEVITLEALRSLREADLELTHPVELVAFSDEEGRFGGLLGSQSLCGLLTPEAILAAEDLDGVRLTDAMAGQGLNAMDALSAQRDPGSIKAFLELHIEQGPVLDRQGITIGAVDAITGLFKWNVRLIGAANHAGTTPMELRRDAFQGLAEFAGQIDRVLEEHGSPRSRTTIGRVELFPRITSYNVCYTKLLRVAAAGDGGERAAVGVGQRLQHPRVGVAHFEGELGGAGSYNFV